MSHPLAWLPLSLTQWHEVGNEAQHDTHTLFFFFFFFCVVLGLELKAYTLSHSTTSFFYDGFVFEIGS
jgi:hypothetical protein